MFQNLSQAFKQTLYNPQDGLACVLGWQLERSSLWAASVCVAILSVLLNGLLVAMFPELLRNPGLLPTSPFLQTLVIWGGLVLTVYGAHYIGRMFGGTGAFDDSFHAMIWLQTMMIVFQLMQLVLLLISPILGGLIGIAAFLATIWLLVNFVAFVHGFRSLLLVFVGVVGSIVGLAFGLVIIYAIIAAVMGSEIQNV